MRKEISGLSLCLAAAAVVALAALLLIPSPRFRNTIVDIRSQHYTPERMLSDLGRLAAVYPESITFGIADTTFEGRLIPVATFGNPDARRHVMVQASMHAREYLSSQLVMALLERYAWSRRAGERIDGVDLRRAFDTVCLTILPMVNPDGVAISQEGVAAAMTRETRRWLNEMADSGYDCEQIKANARGVDLNRNFRNGFADAPGLTTSKDFGFYPGAEPLSEVESRLLLRTAALRPYDCFLNYHTSGNLVYYGCGNADSLVNESARRMALLIERHTGFPGYGPDSAPPNGSWADEVEVTFRKPSATIELGTRNPVPIEQFPDLLERNTPVWADLARSLDTL
ncbi:MAG: hypothetical protein NC336_01995 [Clostridium sp.]|nr:hypothetical protein [Clostridium sp.]